VLEVLFAAGVVLEVALARWRWCCLLLVWGWVPETQVVAVPWRVSTDQDSDFLEAVLGCVSLAALENCVSLVWGSHFCVVAARNSHALPLWACDFCGDDSLGCDFYVQGCDSCHDFPLVGSEVYVVGCEFCVNDRLGCHFDSYGAGWSCLDVLAQV